MKTDSQPITPKYKKEIRKIHKRIDDLFREVQELRGIVYKIFDNEEE